MSSPSYAPAQKLFRAAINTQHPDTYVDTLSSAFADRHLTLRDAVLVMFQKTSPQLWGTLIHKNAATPSVTRDDRLLAWFQACETLGADVPEILSQEIKNQRDFRSSAKCMLRARAIKTIRWWQGHGLEAGLSLTVNPHRPTNLASLAVYCGAADMAEALAPGTALTHPEILWPRLWSKSMLPVADRLAALLISQGPVPANFMEALPQSAINLKNAPSVVGLAARLVKGQHVVLTPRQATENLTSLVKYLRSPASLELVRFFLDYGADPIARGPGGPLSTALDAWERTTLSSGLRATHLRCVEMLVDAAPSEALLSVLTPDRVAKLTTAFRQKHPAPRAPMGDDGGAEIAWLRHLVLNRSLSPDPRPEAAAARM